MGHQFSMEPFQVLFTFQCTHITKIFASQTQASDEHLPLFFT